MLKPKIVLFVIVLILFAGCTAERGAPDASVPDTTETTTDKQPTDRQASPVFETYANDRFGFSVAYPSDVLPSVNRSQNGDGAVLSSSSEDITLRVSASHNVLGKTLMDVVETARADFSNVASEEGRQVYAVLRGTGTDGKQLVKRVALRDEDIFKLALSYPAGTLEQSMVEHIVSSFEINSDDGPTGFLVKVALLDYAAADGSYEKESTGEERGCDRVVLVDRNVERTDAPLTAALEELFALDQFEVAGWQNFLAKTNLSFDRVTVQNGTASIYLTGELSGLAGVCDNPRARIQIEETALQFPTVDKVVFYLNGEETDLTPDERGAS